MDKRGLIKLSVLGAGGLAVVFVFLGILFGVFSSAVIDKEVYDFGEKVRIDLKGIDDYKIKLKTPSASYVKKGSNDVLAFRPQEEGRHEVTLSYGENKESYEFHVFKGSEGEGGLFSEEDGEIFEVSEDYDESHEVISEVIGLDDVEVEEFYEEEGEDQIDETDDEDDGEDDEFRDPDGFVQLRARAGEPVKWVKKGDLEDLGELRIHKGRANLKVEKILSGGNKEETRNFEVKGGSVVGSVASRVSGEEERDVLVINEPGEYEISYETAAPTVVEEILSDSKKKVTVSSDVHYKDVLTYTELPMEVRKQLVKVYWLKEGKRYEIPILNYFDEDGNGLVETIRWYAPHLSEEEFEISIEVLTVQSYPAQGGNWTVEFATSGQADLTIKAVNGTTWSDTTEDGDLKFLELKCGEVVKQYEWIDDSVFIEGYECDDVGYETSKVITPGRHHLEFDFGGTKAYAHNDAVTLVHADAENVATRTVGSRNHVTLDDGTIIIVWEDDANDLGCSESTDGGLTWGNTGFDAEQQRDMTIATNGTRIIVFVYDVSSDDVYYEISDTGCAGVGVPSDAVTGIVNNHYPSAAFDEFNNRWVVCAPIDTGGSGALEYGSVTVGSESGAWTNVAVDADDHDHCAIDVTSDGNVFIATEDVTNTALTLYNSSNNFAGHTTRTIDSSAIVRGQISARLMNDGEDWILIAAEQGNTAHLWYSNDSGNNFYETVAHADTNIRDVSACIDAAGDFHVVYTDVVSGTDEDIYYVNYTIAGGWGTEVLLADSATQYRFSAVGSCSNFPESNRMGSNETSGWTNFTVAFTEVAPTNVYFANRDIVVAPMDPVYPSFSSYTEVPANGSVYSSGVDYEFNSTISLSNGTAGVEFDGANYSASVSGSVYDATVSDLAVGVYSYYWWALGNGPRSNFNRSTTRYYTVSTATSSVNLELDEVDDNMTVEVGSTVNITAFRVAGEGDIRVYNDGSLIAQGSGPLENLTLFDNLGTYNITVIYEATQNYTRSSETHFVTVQDTLSPTWTNQNHSSDTVSSGGTNNLWATWSDNFQLESVWLSTNESGVWQNYSTRKAGLTLDDFSDNTNTYVDEISATATKSDVGGYVLGGLNLSYNYDSGVSDDTFHVVINISTTDFTAYENITYHVKADQASLHRTSLILLSSGVACDATSAQTITGTDWTRIIVNVDDITGSCTQTAITQIRVIFSDDNDLSSAIGQVGLDELYLTNDTLSGVVSNFTWRNDSIVIGSVSWRMYMNDTSGNLNQTDILTFDVTDSIFPNWSNPVESPTDTATYLQGADYQFNVTWEDNIIIDNVRIQHNFTGGDVNNFSISGNVSSEYYYDTSDIGVGTYYWMMVANDSAGNENETDWFTYTVNPTSSAVNLTLNGTQGNFTIIPGDSVNLTGNRINGEGVIRLYNEGSLINIGNGPLENMTQFDNPGVYNITVIYEATQNYTRSSLTYYVNVSDTESPQWASPVESPADPATYSQGADYQFNVTWTDNFAMGDVRIQHNFTGGAVANFSVSGNVSSEYYYDTSDLGVGTYWWMMLANDTSGNENETAWYTYTVDPTTSEVNLTLNGTDDNFTVEVGDSVNLTANLLVGEGVIRLYNEGSLINIGSGPLENMTQFSMPGEYNITVIYEATQNYSRSSETHYVTVQDTAYPIWTDQGQGATPISQGDTIDLYATWADNYNLESVWLSTNESGVWQNYTSRRAGLTMNDFSDSSLVVVDPISATASINEILGGYVRDAVNLSYEYDSGVADDTFDVIINISTTNINLHQNISYYVKADQANFHRTSLLAVSSGTACDATTPQTISTTEWELITFNMADISGSCTKTAITQFRIRFSDDSDGDTGSGNITLDELYLTNDTLSSVVSNFTWKNDSIATGGVSWRIYMNDSAGNLNQTDILTFTLEDSAFPTWSGNVTSPASPATYSQGADYQFNVTWADNIGMDTVVMQHNFTGGSLSNYSISGNVSGEYYYNYSDMGVGTYYWMVIGNDTAGNENYTDWWTYTVNPTSSSVNLTLNGTQGNFTIVPGDSVNLTANKITGEGIIRLYNEGSLINLGNGPLENMTQFDNPGVYNITVIYEATQNYTRSSLTYYVNVSDAESPQWSGPIESPADPATYSQGADYQFNVTWTDNFAMGDVRIQHNFTGGAVANFSISGNVSSEYYYDTSDLGVGIYWWMMLANDTSGNENETDWYTYTVDSTTSEVNLTLNGTDDNFTISPGDSVNLTANKITGEGIIRLYNGGSLINIGSGPLENMTQFDMPGEYNITVIYEATQNYSQSSETHYVIVQDIDNPTWNNQGQGATPISQGDTIDLYATWADNYNLESVWLSTNESGVWQNYTSRRAGLTMNDFADSSLVVVDPISASASINEVIDGAARDAINLSYEYDSGFADDTFDVVVNVSTTDINLYQNISYYVRVDQASLHRTSLLVISSGTACNPTTPQTISSTGWQLITFNTADIGGSCTESAITQFRIRFSDESDSDTGSGNVTLDELYLTNDTLSSVVSNFTWQNASISGGYISWRIYMNDSAGNLNQTDILTFLVQDIIYPLWSSPLESPADPATYSQGAEYQFNVTWSDNVAMETVTMQHNFSGGALTNETVTTESSGEYYFDVSDLAVGTYYWMMIGNDSGGNENQTDWYTYTVDPAASSVNLTLNGTDGNFTIEASDSVNLTGYRLAGEGVIRLYNNGSLINVGNGPLENVTVFGAIGEYNITVTYEATQNFTRSTETHYLTVEDAQFPGVSQNSPADGYNSSVSEAIFNVSVSDNYDIVNVSLWANFSGTWGINQTNTSGLNSMDYLFNVSNIPDAGYIWAIEACDSSGNCNITGNRSLMVDTTFPLIDYGGGTDDDGVNRSRDWIYVNVSVTEVNEVNITFSLYNLTAEVNSTTFIDGTRTINWTGLPDTNYTYNVTIVDRAGNTNITSTRGIVLDDTAPEWSSPVESPADAATYSLGQDYQFNVTWTDNLVGIDEVRMQHNFSGGALTNETVTTESSGEYYSDVSDLAVGVYWWMMIANDSLGNENETDWYTYTVDPAASEVNLTLNGADGNMSVAVHSLINLTGYMVAGERIIWLYNNGSLINQGSGPLENMTAFNETGEFNITVVYEATQNYTRSSETHYVIVGDSEFPSVTQNIPVDYYNSSNSNVTFNASVSDNLGIVNVSLWANFSGTWGINETNTSGLNNLDYLFDVEGINDSIYVWAVEACDAAGNCNLTGNRSLTVDTTPPNITDGEINKTASLVINEYVRINCTVTDALIGLDTVSISVDKPTLPTQNYSTSILAGDTYYADVQLVEAGNWSFECIANDTLNNLAVFDIVNVSVAESLAAPSVPVLLYPVDGANLSALPSQFNWSNSTDPEGDAITYIIEIDDDPGFSSPEYFNGSIAETDDPTEDTSISLPVDNVYYWHVRSSDGLQNSSFSAARTFVLDRNLPTIELVFPDDDADLTVDDINFTWNVSDNLDLEILCDITIDGSVNASDISSNNGVNTSYLVENIVDGLHTWNITCRDWANSNTSVTREFTTYTVSFPLIFNATLNPDNSSVNLWWSNVTDADYYEIFISDNLSAGFSSTPNYTGVTDLNFTDSNAGSVKRRFYKISAVDGLAENQTTIIVGKVDRALSLASGFNLVSFPLNVTGGPTLNAGAGGYNPTTTPWNCTLSMFRYNGSRFEETVNDNGVWTPAIGDDEFTGLEPLKGYWLETDQECNITFVGEVPTQNITKELNTTFTVAGWHSPYDSSFGEVATYGDPLYVEPTGAIDNLFRYNTSKAVANPNLTGFQGVHYFSGYGWWPFFGDDDFDKLESGIGYYFEVPSQAANWTHDPTFGS